MKKFIVNKFNDLKLRDKLMISFIGVILIPILIVGLFLTQELRKNATRDALEATTANIDRVKKPTYDIFKAYTSYNDFRYYEQTYPIVNDIHFLIDNPTMLNNWSFIPMDKTVENLDWYQETVQANGLILWKYIPSQTKPDEYYLSLVRKINFLENKTFGILIIMIDGNQLNWMLNQETSPIYIVDDESNIVASNHPEYIGSKITGLIHTPFPTKKLPQTIEGIVNEED